MSIFKGALVFFVALAGGILGATVASSLVVFLVAKFVMPPVPAGSFGNGEAMDLMIAFIISLPVGFYVGTFIALSLWFRFVDRELPSRAPTWKN